MIKICAWTPYFAELPKANTGEFKDSDEFQTPKCWISNSSAEVEKGLSEGKKGRSTGPVDVNLELLKYGDKSTVNWIVRLDLFRISNTTLTKRRTFNVRFLRKWTKNSALTTE